MKTRREMIGSGFLAMVGVLAGCAGGPPVRASRGCCPSGAAGTAASHETPPTGSLYDPESPWQDDGGHSLHLSDFSGGPVLVSMFFSYCELFCPVTLENLRALRASLSETERKSVPVLLISFDPTRDTPERLHQFRKANRLAVDEWKLLRAAPAQVRALATALGVRYQEVAPGRFSHSTEISLLDRKGRLVHQESHMQRGFDSMVSAVRRALAASPG